MSMHLSTYLFGKLPLVSERRKKRSATGGEYKNLNLKKNTLVYIIYIYTRRSWISIKTDIARVKLFVHWYIVPHRVLTILTPTQPPTSRGTYTYSTKYEYILVDRGLYEWQVFTFFHLTINEPVEGESTQVVAIYLVRLFVVLLVSRIRSSHSHRQWVKIKKFQTNVGKIRITRRV